jgi:hypothetical protein
VVVAQDAFIIIKITIEMRLIQIFVCCNAGVSLWMRVRII